MKNRIFGIVLILTLLLLTLAGCGNYGASDADAGYASGSGESYLASDSSFSLNSSKKISLASGSSDVGTSLSDSTVTDGSKLVKTAYATIKTENYETAVTKLQERIEELGGRIDSEQYNGYEPRSATLTIRIPVEKYATFTGEFSSYGVVTSLSANVDDVTTSYAETLAKKEMLEQKVAKYKDMLDALDGSAKTETVVSLTEAYYDSMTDLARIQKTLDTLTDKVTFSTIYLNLDEVKSEAAVVKDSIFKRIGDTFRESVGNLAENAGDVLVWFFGNIVEIVLWCGILVGAFFLVRHFIRKRRAKNAVSFEKTSEEKVVEKPVEELKTEQDNTKK